MQDVCKRLTRIITRIIGRRSHWFVPTLYTQLVCSVNLLLQNKSFLDIQ
jgi:hypothetical protein